MRLFLTVVKRVFLVLVAGFGGVSLWAASQAEVPAEPVKLPEAPAVAAKPVVPAESAEPGKYDGQPVFVLPIKGPIDKSLLMIFRRAFRQAQEVHPRAIIIEMETPGGGLRETEEIIAWMRSVQVPVYTFVNTHAQSAGAIIGLGTDAIFMAPGSRIGSAMPIAIGMDGGIQQLPEDVKEKLLSDVRSLVRGLAQEHHHAEEVAMAMVDPERGLKIGDRVICASGQLLNLTAKEAVEIIHPNVRPLLAQAIVPDIPTLLEQVHIPANATVVRFSETSAEKASRWITTIGPLLLALGLICLYIEFKTPGVMLPGIVGGCLLVVYFFGHYVAGLAGFEEIAMVVLGIILLGVEVFIFPTVGILAVAGLALMVTGIVMGLIPFLPTAPTPLPDVAPLSSLLYLTDALFRLLATVLIGGVGVAILARFLPKTALYRNVVLNQALTQEQGYVAHNPGLYEGLLGKTGLTVTLLRPSGIAEVDGRRLDVVSSGDLIPKDSRIKVVSSVGGRIVVERTGDGIGEGAGGRR